MKLFVDTSAWLALNDKNDQYHKRAVKKSLKVKRQRIEIVTSEYVIDESEKQFSIISDFGARGGS